MEIIPIAFDSFGTRSMATFVETKDCQIIIDPSVALGPSRYGLPPHRLEFQRQDEHWQSIINYAAKADIIIITHYHYDHHNPDYPDIFKDKILFLKDPQNNINLSQTKRAKYFQNIIAGYPKEVYISENKEYKQGDTKIKFSKAVYHGTNPRLGFVTEVSIEDAEKKFLFTSDVEGPAIDDQRDFILQENPDIIFCDGPMTYMLGFRYAQASLQASIENLIMIIQETKVEQLILDHHLTRDLNWREKLIPVFNAGKREGCAVLTAANFLGIPDAPLEAKRKELYALEK